MSSADSIPSFANKHANINLLWAELLIEELIRFGVSDFCIAPGSRSTPLTLAVANHHQARSHVHFDERGLGFLALGLSKSTNKPVVVITTSGSAVANLYPAVIEAKQSNVPLIILSADRPPELLGCAANQAIDQHRIFANYPVFFAQVPSPTTSIKASFLLTTIAQGLFQQQQDLGPIHLNMAFQEPFYPQGQLVDFSEYLQPLSRWLESSSPFTELVQPINSEDNKAEIKINASKIIIIVGRMQDTEQAQAIAKLCQQQHFMLLADIQSQLQSHQQNLVGYDLLLENKQLKEQLLESDLIIQFSGHLVSKRLQQMIEQSQSPIWQISEHNQRIDPGHNVCKRFKLSAKQFCQQVKNEKAIDKQWYSRLHQTQQYLSNIIHKICNDEILSEINVTRYLLTQSNQQVMVGNSLAIRIADMFAQNQANIFTNRGASGIDGLLATSIGIAKGKQQTTSLLIGDTSFLYDLNSLALLKQLSSNFIIVLLNNDGGGIFNLLPVPSETQERFYQVPHGLNFQHSCQQFNINYQRPSSFNEFKKQLNNAMEMDNQATLIEVCVNNQLTPSLIDKVKSEVKDALIL